MKYRKKPVEVEAHRVAPETIQWIANWCGGIIAADSQREGGDAQPYIAIATMEGVMAARMGAYVIQGVAGEFYPCAADIFDATYEVAEGAT